MSYVRARWETATEERLFREYVTESLRLRGENKFISNRWTDIITKTPVDTRTPEEIAAEVVRNAGLTRKGGTE